MSIISKESFKNLPEEEKEKIVKYFLGTKDTEVSATTIMLKLFDKEDLQPKPKTPKVWSDMETLHEEVDTAFVELEESLRNIDCETKLFNKILATYQIQQLIDLGYGGTVSEEEWRKAINEGRGFYTISWSIFYKSFHINYETYYKSFLSFRSRELAEEFMSYPENIELLRQFNMI